MQGKSHGFCHPVSRQGNDRPAGGLRCRAGGARTVAHHGTGGAGEALHPGSDRRRRGQAQPDRIDPDRGLSERPHADAAAQRARHRRRQSNGRGRGHRRNGPLQRGGPHHRPADLQQPCLARQRVGGLCRDRGAGRRQRPDPVLHVRHTGLRRRRRRRGGRAASRFSGGGRRRGIRLLSAADRTDSRQSSALRLRLDRPDPGLRVADDAHLRQQPVPVAGPRRRARHLRHALLGTLLQRGRRIARRGLGDPAGQRARGDADGRALRAGHRAGPRRTGPRGLGPARAGALRARQRGVRHPHRRSPQQHAGAEHRQRRRRAQRVQAGAGGAERHAVAADLLPARTDDRGGPGPARSCIHAPAGGDARRIRRRRCGFGAAEPDPAASRWRHRRSRADRARRQRRQPERAHFEGRDRRLRPGQHRLDGPSAVGPHAGH